MIRSCDPSRSRYAIFRLLSRFGIGCSIDDSSVDQQLLIASSRQNPLEGWFVGGAFYVLYGALFIALTREMFSIGAVGTSLLVLIAPFVAFGTLVGTIAMAWAFMYVTIPASRRDPAGQPSRQATAQQLLLLALCSTSFAWGPIWLQLMALVWISLVVINAMISLVVPYPRVEQEDSRLELPS